MVSKWCLLRTSVIRYQIHIVIVIYKTDLCNFGSINWNTVFVSIYSVKNSFSPTAGKFYAPVYHYAPIIVNPHLPQVRIEAKLEIKCDWIWEKPPSTHNYKYLEIPILVIWSSITREGKYCRCLNEVSQDSIAIYDLSIHQLLAE